MVWHRAQTRTSSELLSFWATVSTGLISILSGAFLKDGKKTESSFCFRVETWKKIQKIYKSYKILFGSHLHSTSSIKQLEWLHCELFCVFFLRLHKASATHQRALGSFYILDSYVTQLRHTLTTDAKRCISDFPTGSTRLLVYERCTNNVFVVIKYWQYEMVEAQTDAATLNISYYTMYTGMRRIMHKYSRSDWLVCQDSSLLDI